MSEKIIQIAGIGSVATLLTNEGRVFFQKPGERDWIEATLPTLHTNEIDHEIPEHSCTQCVEVNAHNTLTNPN